MTRYDWKTGVGWIYGTHATPQSLRLHRVHNIVKSPEKSVDNPNPSYAGVYQPAPARPGGRYFDFGFSTELRGSDTADVPPPDSALLRACAMVETVNGTTPNIGYKYKVGDPHIMDGNPDGDVDPIALVLYQDGLYRAMTDCVGNAVFTFAAGRVPTIDYKFLGLIAAGTKGWLTGTAPAFLKGANPRPIENAGLTCTITRTGTVTGTVTGTTSTTVLIDSAATFISSGVYAGDTLAMTVGGYTATVVTVDSNTQITTTALSGAATYDSGEAYTITRATTYATTSSELVIPSITYDLGNILMPRPDINGEEGFSKPIIPGRTPKIQMVMEVPQIYDLNPEYIFIEGQTLDIAWTHEDGYGDRHELACKFSGVINSEPEVTESNGKLMYTINMDQAIETTDDPFELSWQGT